MTKLQPREIGLITAALSLAADQGFKLFMLYGAGFAHMAPGERVPVLPFFNLVMVWNPGISYGLFPANSRMGIALLVTVAVAAVAFLGWLLWRTANRALAVGYGLIIGGAVGNLIDRLLYGKVADFFHFHGFGYDWYIFNVADIWVTLGAVAIIYDVLKPDPSWTRLPAMRFEMRNLSAARLRGAHLQRILAIACCAAALAGCSNLRELAGLQKKSPDEFAVSTKAPLVIPPDFNLRPPLPGAPPTNQLDPSGSAEQALFSNADPQTVAAGMRGNYTPAEKMLLANAGVQNSDAGVRVKLNADQRSAQNADRSFTDRVLGASATPDTGKPVNGDAEVSKRNGGNKATTKNPMAAAGLTGSRRAALLAAGLIATVSAAAQTGDRSKLSAPAPATAQQTGNSTFQFALANGMQVLVIPDHRAPVATQMLWFRVGGVDDPPGISGLAHFFEHMMFRGTKLNPNDTFSQTIAKNGGETNAFTDHDYTAFYEQIAKDRLPLAMKLEADRLANLDLSDAHVAPERDVVLEERRMRVDNSPQSLMSEQMQAALHMSHPYGRPVIGWADEVRRIDRVSAQNFYDHHYAPNNAILVIAGDVTPDEVRKMAQDAYGKVAARALQPRSDPTEPPRLAESRMVFRRSDARVPVFSRIYRVPSYATGRPGQAESLEAFAQLVGGDQTSVLYRALVEQKKLATDAGASYDGNVRDQGEFAVYAVPRPGVSLEAVEKAVDQVLAASIRAAPAAADLQRAKTGLVASVIYRRDSQFALASAYGQALAIGLTVDDVNEWPARIRAVNGDDIRKAAAALSRKNAVTGYMVPEGGQQ